MGELGRLTTEKERSITPRSPTVTNVVRIMAKRLDGQSCRGIEKFTAASRTMVDAPRRTLMLRDDNLLHLQNLRVALKVVVDEVAPVVGVRP